MMTLKFHDTYEVRDDADSISIISLCHSKHLVLYTFGYLPAANTILTSDHISYFMKFKVAFFLWFKIAGDAGWCLNLIQNFRLLIQFMISAVE